MKESVDKEKKQMFLISMVKIFSLAFGFAGGNKDLTQVFI